MTLDHANLQGMLEHNPARLLKPAMFGASMNKLASDGFLRMNSGCYGRLWMMLLLEEAPLHLVAMEFLVWYYLILSQMHSV